MFFLCLMEAQKFYDDESFTNKDYAKVCGVSPNELLLLETEFMDLIEFNLFIQDNDFIVVREKFEKLWRVHF